MGAVQNLAYQLGFAIGSHANIIFKAKIPIAISFLPDISALRCSHFDGKTDILNGALQIAIYLNEIAVKSQNGTFLPSDKKRV